MTLATCIDKSVELSTSTLSYLMQGQYILGVWQPQGTTIAVEKKQWKHGRLLPDGDIDWEAVNAIILEETFVTNSIKIEVNTPRVLNRDDIEVYRD